ncbi:MAG: hypothetical protein VZQ47_08000 [Treponema sp.]|nr:hypothetical protein [Treponema sp.]MEE3435484.1 hypothetical protein [Treponema sp.]
MYYDTQIINLVPRTDKTRLGSLENYFRQQVIETNSPFAWHKLSQTISEKKVVAKIHEELDRKFSYDGKSSFSELLKKETEKTN